MPVQSNQYTMPISKRDIHNFLRAELRVKKPHLTIKLTSKEVDRGYDFLQGYYTYMSKELMPPLIESEINQHLFDVVYPYVLHNLEE